MQFYRESLLTRMVPVSRPRVYLIDFEPAIEFPVDCPPSERLCIGPPCINSLSDVDKYTAPRIPEMDAGEPYDPFKLDVWQLATSLLDFDVRRLWPAHVQTYLTKRSLLCQRWKTCWPTWRPTIL